ncbi:uncharacterized protein [Gossypium hirsutum]|uniref:Uncharacterized protein n=1 Tax=Gossypium hirsutum TaxID=3635 RepID=A0A1U8KWZ6_GOSHI|nr:uncharacterized protein LOC107921632 [Gossypium hirsutum]
MVPNRLTLQMMEKKPTETFKQYAQRWRDISAQVEPSLTKTEITVLFINTLKALFYDKLVESATKDFADIVISRELIENTIKRGRMEGPESSKRAVPVRKKKVETHMVKNASHNTSNPYSSQPRPHYRLPSNFYFPPQGSYYPTPSLYPVYAMNNQRLFAMFPPNTMPTQSQPKNDQRPAKPSSEKPQFTIIPVPYGELYLKLLKKQLISPHYMAPLKPPYPKWDDPNASCTYHARNQGHSTENCLALKRRVQDLIDAGILRFDGVSNMAGNPLPNHTDGNVNAVTNEDGRRAKSCVAKVKTPLRNVWEMMVKKGLLCPQNRIVKEENIIGPSFCDFHGTGEHDIQSCKGFRKLLQDMMDNKEVKIFDRIKEADEGEICVSEDQPSAIPYSADRPLVIYYEAKNEEVKPKVIIEVPSPFPYKDSKAISWRYDVNIVVPEGEKSKATAGSVSGVGHFTRNGRCYSLEMVEPKKKVIVSNQKGKAPLQEDEIDVEISSE